MRRKNPLIIGAGPAGCAAAITMASAGLRPLLLERSRETGDALCGGFVSWRTMETLKRLGVSVSGHPIRRLRLFAGTAQAEAPLPETGFGISRRSMDTALLAAALKAGAGVERGVTVRHLDDVAGHAPALFLATGKHDLKGCERPRTAQDPALGLRIRLPHIPGLAARIGDAIELHFFDRGYAGIEIQEDGTANICLALRKSLLAEAGRDPAALLTQLAGDHPHFADRLTGFSAQTPIDAVAGVPYGWRQTTDPGGFFRLGDQCAVIPSLAGEGNGIALASGESAARAFIADIGPHAWQNSFAGRTSRPVRLASALWRLGEKPIGGYMATQLLAAAPNLAQWMARATRVTSGA